MSKQQLAISIKQLAKYFIGLLGYWVIGLILTTSVLAATATSSASPKASAIPQEQIKEKIKERLEKVVSEGLDKVRGTMEQAAPKYYAYFGTVKTITDSNISLTTLKGDRQVEIASQAAIVRVTTGKEKTNVKIKDLATDQYLIVMGTKKDDEVLVGKRIIITSNPGTTNKRKLIIGKVTEIDNKKVTIKTNDKEEQLIVDSKTKLKVVGINKPSVDDIQIGDQLITIVTLDKNGKIDLVKTILVVPGKANPAAAENEIEATPSASPKKKT